MTCVPNKVRAGEVGTASVRVRVKGRDPIEPISMCVFITAGLHKTKPKPPNPKTKEVCFSKETHGHRDRDRDLEICPELAGARAPRGWLFFSGTFSCGCPGEATGTLWQCDSHSGRLGVVTTEVGYWQSAKDARAP